MDYKQYFNKLIKESNVFSNRFPKNYHFTHKKNNYRAEGLSYKGVHFNYTVSSSRSRTYGEEFEGLIVELYIHKKGYVDSYYNQLIFQREQIENELDINDLVWQPRIDTPKKSVSRLYAKKSVNIEDISKWDEYIEWQVNTMVKFLEVLPKYIDKLKEIRDVRMSESEKEFRNKYKNIVENTIDSSPEINIIKNIILYGSPGVGKTHNTNKLIRLIEDDKSDREIFETIKVNENSDNIDISDIKERVKFVTFHQSFGYEDFVEGYRPNKEGKIALEDGIFKTICDDANNDEEKNYYLVIDEINRGNISKIFGELITLIEEDKRDTFEVTLPYSKKPFKIPSNLYIIGTMNSTDKSIALIDIALRRRFTFLKMKPKATLVTNSKAKEIFNNLNERITQDLGEDYQIGHSYFMKIQNDDALDFVLEYKIFPLLEEYYYGDDRLTEVIALCKQDTILDNND